MEKPHINTKFELQNYENNQDFRNEIAKKTSHLLNNEKKRYKDYYKLIFIE